MEKQNFLELVSQDADSKLLFEDRESVSETLLSNLQMLGKLGRAFKQAGFSREDEKFFRPLFKELMLQKMGKGQQSEAVGYKLALLRCVPKISSSFSPTKSFEDYRGLENVYLVSKSFLLVWVWDYLHDTCHKKLFKERVEIIFSFLA